MEMWVRKPESGKAKEIWEFTEEVFGSAVIDSVARYDEIETWAVYVVGVVTMKELRRFAEKVGVDLEDVEVSAWEEGGRVGLEISWPF